MKTLEQKVVRTLVRSRMDVQTYRKASANRLGKKADGTNQNIIDERYLSLTDMENFQILVDDAKAQEKKIEKMLRKALKNFPIYTEFLKDVKGVGEIAAGWIVGEYDIEEATTVSKMWQYTGLNPGQVKGQKRIDPKKHKGEKIRKEIKGRDGKIEALIVETEEMIRGDKASPGFVLPYNKPLKTALVGVLADGFIKAKSPYALNFYYPYKARLEQSSKEVMHMGKKVPWKDVTKGHRDRAAKRYMIKMFLQDLYATWRALEDLPVREPYQEEYLGHKHSEQASKP